ncbi:MAG: DUF4397 domain-containing protein [Chitinophagaceae bacterium]|nr:MAG: DUF4397 domain-containing protein [Chitinophagaceae bacterium]
MKKTAFHLKIFAFLALVAGIAGCSKENENLVTGTSLVSFTNASAVQTLDIYADNNKISTIPLNPGVTTGSAGNPYFSLDAGFRYIRISSDGTNNLVQGNIPLDADAGYSVFAYDSINTAGTLRALVLTDKPGVVLTGQAQLRYVQLSPDTGRIDLELANTFDTVSFSSQSYIAATNVSESTLSLFRVVKPGNYTIRVKRTNGSILPYSLPVNLSDGGVYTLYSRGRKQNGYGGTANGFNINLISHR